jgi:hypothetical protein
VTILALVSRTTAADDSALLTGEIIRLRESYDSARPGLANIGTNDLIQLFLRYRKHYETSLTQHKRKGNISGMGISRTAMRKLDRMIEEVSVDKPFDAVGRVRRELVKEFGLIEAAALALQKAQAGRAADLEESTFRKFMAVYENADAASEDVLRERFATAMRSAARPAAGTTPSGGSTNDTTVYPPAVLAASGEAPVWVTLGFWLAEVGGIDIFEVALTGAVDVVRSKGRHSMNNLAYQTAYRPIRQLVLSEEMQFRTKPVPGRRIAEVVDWPTPRNGWQMSVRVRSVDSIKSPHGIEIQVGMMIADAIVPAARNEAPARAAPAVVSVATTPPGATVYVDGERYQEAGRAVLTPCKLMLGEGKHSIVLRRRGYRAIAIRNQVVTNGLYLERILTPNVKTVDTAVEVRANRKWTRSNVSVKKGDHVNLTAAGRWHCGDQDDTTGPAGYPNNKKYFKYYVDAKKYPRQTPKARYGALLMRIGREGAIRRVGTSLRFVSEQDGQLYFDINEDTTASIRRDNGGILSIQIRQSP